MKLGDLLIILDLHNCDKYTVAPKILHVWYDFTVHFREYDVQSVPSLQVLKELGERSLEASENGVAHGLQLSVQVYLIIICDTSINKIYVSFAEIQDP
jgi:hypothetical protein